MHGVTRLAAFGCVLLLSGTAPSQDQSIELRSPDGKTVLVVGMLEPASGNCGYALSHDGRVILRPSTFALTFKDEPAFGEHLRVASVARSRSAGQWKPVYGERGIVPDAYNQVVLSCSESRPPHRTVEMTFRAYDEGVAFRYVVEPSEGRGEAVLLEEHSRFVFERDFPAWVAPTARGRYERLPISSMGNDRERPLVVEMDAGLHVALGEAKLVDFARMKLSAAGGPFPALESRLSGEVRLALPAASPWRYVMIGATPAQLLERNYLVLNLNDPPALADVSWIKPGKVIRDVTLTTQGGLACVDFAAARGLQYVEFDAGWYGPENSESSSALAVDVDPRRSAGPLDLPRIIQHADRRNIGVILYVNRRALERQIGEYATMARRKGQEWFVASLTGEQGRAVEIPLSFLEKSRHYTAVLYFDDAQVQTRTGVGREERRVVSSTVLRHVLGKNQGLAVVIRPR